jgi:nitrogen fixation protein NifU and related proteins
MNDIDTMYREVILDLYRNPLNKKLLDDFDVEFKEFNPACGDEISVQLKFYKDKVSNIGHVGEGCAISQAAISLVTDQLLNKTKIEVEKFSENDVYELLGFEPIYTRQKCATLGLDAIKKAML